MQFLDATDLNWDFSSVHFCRFWPILSDVRRRSCSVGSVLSYQFCVHHSSAALLMSFRLFYAMLATIVPTRIPVLTVAVWRKSRDGVVLFYFVLFFYGMPCNVAQQLVNNKLTRWIVATRTKVKWMQNFFPVKLWRETKKCTDIFDGPTKISGTDGSRKHRMFLCPGVPWLKCGRGGGK